MCLSPMFDDILTPMRTLFYFVAATILASPISAMAAVPAVGSFTLSPTVISNNDMTTAAWRVVNGSGSSLSFACPAGVSVKKMDGSAFPCNTREIINTSVTGSAAFRITNISGMATTVIATLYPKDAVGNDFDDAIAQSSLTVGTAPRPITNAFASSSSPTSGTPLTVTWTAPDVAATNLQLECRPGLRYTQADGITALPCATPAFSAPLPASGSATIVIFNDTNTATTTTIRVLPAFAVSPAAYDPTHVALVPVTVSAKTAQQITPPGSGAATVSTGSTIISGTPLNFSWTTQNSVGANMIFSCNDSLTYLNTVGTSTQPLSCGVPAFASVLPVSGTATLSFINHSTSTQQTTLLVLPQRANGTYDPNGGTNAVLLVLPAPESAPAPAVTSQATDTPHPNPRPLRGEGAAQAPITPAITTTPIATAHAPLTTPLKRGSRGAQVTILQTFLAQDPAIYPEAAITGYFGAATIQAVERFQDRYTISSSNDPSYGTVGPNTRAKINALTQP